MAQQLPRPRMAVAQQEPRMAVAQQEPRMAVAVQQLKLQLQLLRPRMVGVQKRL